MKPIKITRKWIIILAVVGVAGAIIGYLIYNSNLQKTIKTAATYQTIKLEKGSLIATVGATGTVRSSQNAVLTWLTSGRVGEVYVSMGQMVKEDEILAKLEASSLSQTVILAQGDLINAQTALDNLFKQSDLTLAQAQSALVTAQKAYDDAKKNRVSQNYPRVSDTMIDQALSDLESAKRDLAIAQDEYDKYKYVDIANTDRIKALNNLTTQNNRVQDYLTKYNWYSGKPTTQDLAKSDADLAVARTKLEDAQRTYDRVKNGPAADDVAIATARRDSAQATVNLARLAAPFSGTITDAQVKKGDMVTASTVAFRIDDTSAFYIDLQVSEVDINRIQVGEKVNITFDAIREKEYHGLIDRISQVGIVSSGVVNFQVTVKMSDPDAAVKPGMTAAANVIVNQIDDILKVPNRAIRTVNNKRSVYIMDSGNLKPVNIEIGVSSDTETEINSGDLKIGDLIVLNPPTITSFGPGGGGSPPGGGAQGR